jgi:hypothetical protein
MAVQVREILARSSRISRHSAILVESSRQARERDALVPQCAWCGRVRVGVWAQPQELPPFLADLLANRRTHGICPTCLDDVQHQGDGPLPPTIVVIRAGGRTAVESLSRWLDGHALRERPDLALEVTLPEAGGNAVNQLLSAVSTCLDENGLGPVTIELSDRTYVLGEH